MAVILGSCFCCTIPTMAVELVHASTTKFLMGEFNIKGDFYVLCFSPVFSCSFPLQPTTNDQDFNKQHVLASHQHSRFRSIYTRTAMGSDRQNCIITLAIITLVIGGIIFTLVDYVGNATPKDPKVQLDSIVVSPFNVSSSGPSSSPITANWDVGFSISNPNKFKTRFSYKQLEVSVHYKTEFLAGTELKPFVQHGRNQTSFKVSSAVLEKRFDEWVSTSMAEDLKRGSSVDLNVNLQGWVAYKYGLWGKYKALLTVSCPDVTVKFSSNTTTMTTTGTMLGGSRPCKVTVDIQNQDDNVPTSYYIPIYKPR